MIAYTAFIKIREHLGLSQQDIAQIARVDVGLPRLCSSAGEWCSHLRHSQSDWSLSCRAMEEGELERRCDPGNRSGPPREVVASALHTHSLRQTIHALEKADFDRLAKKLKKFGVHIEV